MTRDSIMKNRLQRRWHESSCLRFLHHMPYLESQGTVIHETQGDRKEIKISFSWQSSEEKEKKDSISFVSFLFLDTSQSRHYILVIFSWLSLSPCHSLFFASRVHSWIPGISFEKKGRTKKRQKSLFVFWRREQKRRYLFFLSFFPAVSGLMVSCREDSSQSSRQQHEEKGKARSCPEERRQVDMFCQLNITTTRRDHKKQEKTKEESRLHKQTLSSSSWWDFSLLLS